MLPLPNLGSDQLIFTAVVMFLKQIISNAFFHKTNIFGFPDKKILIDELQIKTIFMQIHWPDLHWNHFLYVQKSWLMNYK